MTIDVYSSKGTKAGTRDIPSSLLAETVNKGLLHQAVLMQAANARTPNAHVKRRGEVAGSTKKLFSQKHTGNARRGPVRSPVMRGGGKAWGPRNLRTFSRSMPQGMRHAALRAAITLQAKHGAIMGLESYGDAVKTKDAFALLKKMPVELGRSIVIVLPEAHTALASSVRNIPRVQTLLASYLNPRDVAGAKHIIFVGDALDRAAALFGTKTKEKSVKAQDGEEKPKKKAAPKTAAKKKAAPKKSTPAA